MGMDKHVYGIKLPDEQWHAMAKVWRACNSAHVHAPQEVVAYFHGEPPNESGVLTKLDDHPCVRVHNAESEDGFEIDLELVPEGTRMIRFVCSH